MSIMAGLINSFYSFLFGIYSPYGDVLLIEDDVDDTVARGVVLVHKWTIGIPVIESKSKSHLFILLFHLLLQRADYTWTASSVPILMIWETILCSISWVISEQEGKEKDRHRWMPTAWIYPMIYFCYLLEGFIHLTFYYWVDLKWRVYPKLTQSPLGGSIQYDVYPSGPLQGYSLAHHYMDSLSQSMTYMVKSSNSSPCVQVKEIGMDWSNSGSFPWLWFDGFVPRGDVERDEVEDEGVPLMDTV